MAAYNAQYIAAELQIQSERLYRRYHIKITQIIEYCNYDNHNALDNDNKGWKMIPNALKGRVIEDDTQFNLSIGLFTKVSENIRCEIYVMAPEDAAEFMEDMYSDLI